MLTSFSVFDVCSKFFHCLPLELRTSNDIYFVVNAWETLLQQIEFLSCTSLYIFSDGGPKHYKCSSNMALWSLISQQKRIKVEYHFYASYHGYGAGDAAIMHVKRAVNGQQRNSILAYKRPEDLNRLLLVDRPIKNHTSLLLTDFARLPPITVSTMHGIKSYHMWTFSSDGTICAYTRSSFQPTNPKTYKIDRHCTSFLSLPYFGPLEVTRYDLLC